MENDLIFCRRQALNHGAAGSLFQKLPILWCMSAVSTYETDLAVLGREDFWLIVAFRGSEDETEIHSG
jgi:hypothetical protein